MRCDPSTSSGSPNGKRPRDPDDELYLDNFHSQKRYLSEIMASSLNGLTVGDSLSESLMESPARSDPMCYLRDEFCSQYSPMSEDSDDCRYCDATPAISVPQSDATSRPSSPVSPHRNQKVVTCPPANSVYTLPGCNLSAVVCCPARQRGSDSEGRYPSSPNDMCHTGDLRKAALLRSVQMRTQPLMTPTYELPFNSGQECRPCDVEDRAYSEIKNTGDNEAEYGSRERVPDLLERCSLKDNDRSDTDLDSERGFSNAEGDAERRGML